jgi:hypothetical protein
MLQKVKFIKKSIYGAKDEEREVTPRAADMFLKLGIIESFEKKEEKTEVETKEEKEIPETKEEKQDSREVMGTKKVPKKEAKKPKVTRSPKF